MLELIGLSSLAFNLDRLPSIPSRYPTEIVSEFPWQQAKGRPHQSTYEREATGRHHDRDDDLEEIRSRSYERRRRGYEYDRDDYYRRDHYDEERYRRDSRHREILEERKERIEEQIEELDDRYGF